MREVIIKVSDKEFETYFANDPNTEELIRCKDCEYFELDHWEEYRGIPLIVAHEICTRWSDGVKTAVDGHCFLGEGRGKDARKQERDESKKGLSQQLSADEA